MASPLITCTMPTYNSAHIVEVGLRSVFEQEYENWELVLVDDSEGPETLQRVCDLTAEYGVKDKVTIVHLSKHTPVSRKRNLAVWAGGGDWIAQFDCDDYQPPCRLRVQLDALLDGGADRRTVCCIPFVHWAMPARDARLWQLHSNGHPLHLNAGSTFFYHRDLWHAIRGYPPGVSRGTDVWFAQRVRDADCTSIAAPSAYAEGYIGLDHGANNWGYRLADPPWVRLETTWRSRTPEWLHRIFEKETSA